MNKVKAAILTFKVMSLMDKFISDYRVLTADIDDSVKKNYDDLVYDYLFKNLKKGKK